MLKFIKRTNAYMETVQNKNIKNYSENQNLLNSYDLTILDKLNHEDQELQNTLERNQEWFYKELIRDQHLGIELINRYFKQRKRLGADEKLISQALKNLSIAQSLLQENDPGYPDILGKNFFISNLYNSFVQDLNIFFNPRFSINCDDFTESIQSLKCLKFKDHQTILHMLNKIKFNFGINTNKQFDLKISRDLVTIPIIKDQLIDQQGFKEYLIKILSIKQPKMTQIEDLDDDKIDNIQLDNNTNTQYENNEIIQEDLLQVNDDQNQTIEDIAIQNEKYTNEVINELDKIFQRTNDFLNNVKILQYKYFSSIKSLRENYFSLTSVEKQQFIEKDPYLLLSLKQFEYQLMQIGILSPRDLIIKESDTQIDKQFDQIISDQIQNLNLDPSLLNLTFQEHSQQIEYDIESLFKIGQQYQFDQNLQSLFNFVQLLKQIDNINEYSYEQLKDKYQDYKDVYEEDNSKYKYYYTNTFHQCRQDIQNIIEKIQGNDLTMMQQLKILIINQTILSQINIKDSLLNSIQETNQLKDSDIKFVLENAYYIDFDILQNIIIKFKDQFVQKIEQNLMQPDQNITSNIGCILSTLMENNLIEEQHIINIFRQLFSLSQLEYLSLNDMYTTQFQIQQVIFMLKYHNILDKEYYEKSYINMQFQEALSRLNNLNKNFKYNNEPILESIRQSFKHFYEEQGFLNKLETDNFTQYPIILNNSNNKIVFLDFLYENYSKKSSLLQSRNYFIEKILSNENKDKKCIQKTIKLSDLTQNKNYYENFDFELKENLNEIIQNTFEKEQKNEEQTIEDLKMIQQQLQNNYHENLQFILGQILHKLIKNLQKHKNNTIVYNRISNQINFLLYIIEQKLDINTQKVRENFIYKEELNNDKNNFNFIGKRSIQNHNLQSQFDNYETKILNYQLYANAEYFLTQEWEIELKDKLTQNQFQQTNKFSFQNYGIVRKILIPSILGRKQKKIENVNIFWDYYMNQDIKLDIKQKLYTLEQFFQTNQSLSQSDLWKLSLLNLSYELRSQTNVIENLQKFLQMKIFSKLLENQSQNNEQTSIFPSKFLNKIIQEKLQIQSPYEKIITPYILYKQEIEYYQNQVQNILPKKIMNEKDQQQQNILKKELEDTQLKYHKQMEKFKKEFTQNYNQLEEKFLMKDYINVLNTQKDSQFKKEEQEIFNKEQLELIITNNLFKNILLYKKEQQLNMTETEKRYLEQYENQISQDYLQNQILLIDQIPNLQINDVFDEDDYKTFENLFPYTELRNFGEQNIKDLLIMISIHLNTEQINQFESQQFVQQFIKQNNLNMNSQQVEDIILLFNDKPQTQLNFNSLYHENKTYQNAQQIDEFEKQIYLEMFSLDRGGSQIDEKWLKKDQEELSQFIDEVNKNSSDPRKDLQNCNLKRFSSKKL